MFCHILTYILQTIHICVDDLRESAEEIQISQRSNTGLREHFIRKWTTWGRCVCCKEHWRTNLATAPPLGVAVSVAKNTEGPTFHLILSLINLRIWKRFFFLFFFFFVQVEGGKSMYSTAKGLWAEEGYSFLYKGVTARIMASVPSSMVIIICYETVKRLSVRTDIQHWASQSFICMNDHEIIFYSPHLPCSLFFLRSLSLTCLDKISGLRVIYSHDVNI